MAKAQKFDAPRPFPLLDDRGHVDYVATNPDFYSPSQEGIEDRMCIEPRFEDRPVQRTAVQTPGGDAGEVVDDALTQTALQGQLVPLKEAFQKPGDPTKEGVGHTHDGSCAFLYICGAYLGKLAATQGDISRIVHAGQWAGYYGAMHDLDMGDVATALSALSEAGRQQDEKFRDERLTQDEMIDLISTRYPGHENIIHVLGEAGLADVYVTNHDPNLRLNREMVKQEGVQFYHDNLGAVVERQLQKADELGLTGVDRALFALSPVLRSAGTIALLDETRAKSNRAPLRHYQATPHHHGDTVFTRELLQ